MTPAQVPVRWLGAVEAVVAGVRGLDGYRAPYPAYGGGVIVFDGPDYQLDSDPSEIDVVVDGEAVPLTLWVSIGWAGDPTQAEESGTSGQVPGPIGPSRSHEETGSIRCCIDGTSGGNDLAPVRAEAFRVLAEIEGWVNASSPPLGLQGFRVATVTDLSVQQQQQADGVWVRLTFSITYSARMP